MTIFHAIEFDLYRPFPNPVGPAEDGYLTVEPLALRQIELTPSSTTTLYAADDSYRTKATDPQGVVPYPPTLIEPFTIEVSANLDPTAPSVGASWGTLKLANFDGRYNAYLPGAGYSSDAQSIRIYRGTKTLDLTRGIWLDPAYASLSKIFAGVMGPWTVTPTGIEIALNDATYYLERQVPRTLYKGSGGYEGSVDLVGTAKPIGLGGTYYALGALPLATIRNVTATVVDGPNLIYQLNDGPVAALRMVYDGGLALTPGGDTTNLYGGVTLPSNFRTDISRGLFQLGSSPAFSVTADFAMALAPASNGLSMTALLRQTLTTLLGVPSALCSQSVDIANPLGLASVGSNPTLVSHVGGAVGTGYQVALFISSQDQPTGLDLVNRFLSPGGALLVGGRDGLLKVLVLCSSIGVTSVLTFDDTNIIDIVAETLPASINPAPWRIRVAYDRNNTPNTGSIAGAVDASTRSWLAAPYRTAASGAVIPVPRATDPAPLGANSGLYGTGGVGQDLVAAQRLSDDQIALWSSALRLYNITVPAQVGVTREWGDPVKVVSDFDGLSVGKLGQIVGWSYSSVASTATFKVLVG